jgi:TonB family protein
MLLRKFAVWIAVAVALLMPMQTQVHAQGNPSPASGRAVTSRIAPSYPDLAKKMHIHGTVKVEAGVRPNGTVKSTRILGGNPVLIEAASDAVKLWKFAPGPAETTEVVQLTFEAQ